ncbi:alpha/beta fold hydrolase [Pseudoduganella armeniaca]|uniref:Alpha/beta hydrolase n=1 Tax=Pseudoduganella armeniaca TaxID=2072590 RepID=A0A2R4CG64_9BURK|nr:alpha/beta hydrolase [Pseudoduganella armeniaca]AVR98585.1 alpha/beta hydrolase [Pseudoduganella armeniaca]
MLRSLSVAALAALLGGSASAAAYGPELQGFRYPYPLQQFRFNSQGQTMKMAYMDVRPQGAGNGQAIVLLHGKNFCGATWEASIAALAGAGWRVIVPDQIGFCASTKPPHYQYSFQQLAQNTMALLQKAGVTKVALLGHSTGGMLATRFALMYPQAVSHLVMVNPIGLEDWKALGVPYRSVDQWFERELKLTADSVRSYEKSTYYMNRWKPAYEKWVDMLAGLNAGPGHQIVAWNSALIYDMIYTQPVVHEFPNLKVPVTLMIGDGDSTAIGSDIAPPELKAKLGNYKVLGKEAAKKIPQAHLIEFPNMGHAPQMEDPEAFHRALLQALDTPR